MAEVQNDVGVFRLLLLPRVGLLKTDRAAIYEFCRLKNIIGVGWNVDGQGRVLDWADYEQKSSIVHSGTDESVLGIKNLRKGDLVWIRSSDPQPQYSIAEIRGAWRYEHSPLHVAADMRNIRDVSFVDIATRDVPQIIQKSFVQKTFQPVADKAAVERTLQLWRTA